MPNFMLSYVGIADQKRSSGTIQNASAGLPGPKGKYMMICEGHASIVIPINMMPMNPALVKKKH